MSVKLLTEQCLEILSLKGDCIGSSEATIVKMPHCWKSCVTAHYVYAMAICMESVLVFGRDNQAHFMLVPWTNS